MSWCALVAMATVAPIPAQAGPAPTPQRIEWARLKSGSPHWSRHSAADGAVLRMMRQQTALAMHPVVHSADAERVDELCTFPFVFADSVAELSEAGRRNLAEYLRRGGFILIDACRNKQINPDIEAFWKAQVATLANEFPRLRVSRLAPTHEVFSVHFRMMQFPPYRHSDGPEPLRALYDGDRMVGMISLNGFQCGWAGYGDAENNAADCVQMVANIYIYAMTR